MNVFTKDFSVSNKDVKIQRSVFNRSSKCLTSFQEGSLVPIFADEVLPGDTCSVKTSALVRMVTPLVPVLGDAYIDVYFFYVPNRLLWSHWEELCGANKTTYWDDVTEWVLPGHNTSGPVLVGSVMDYLGYPVGTASSSWNIFPLLSYYKIYDDFFRDENLIAPHSFLSTYYNAANGTNICGTFENMYPCKAGKYHDYFTSCLPSPQKGAAVSLPLGDVAYAVEGQHLPVGFLGDGSWAIGNNIVTSNIGQGGVSDPMLLSVNNGGSNAGLTAFTASNGLAIDLSTATASTINQLRLAFQTQRLLERDARGGTRYTEQLRSHFGVVSPDSRVQRPEYLGGFHQRLSMSQVEQTAPAETSGVGNLGAMSVTGVSSDGRFFKSFDEHGWVIGLAVVRVKQSYNQGVPRAFTRRRRFDFYWPTFANIGEQPVYKTELFATAPTDAVFGYQEAWADYRYKPDIATGLMRTSVTGDLGSLWTYGSKFTAAPSLNQAFIEEDASIINRTVSVTSTDANPVMFRADFLFDNKCARPMPLYSVPGVIDHN